MIEISDNSVGAGPRVCRYGFNDSRPPSIDFPQMGWGLGPAEVFYCSLTRGCAAGP